MKRLISIAMLALLLCSVSFAQDDAAKKKAAQASAESWMALVDAGDYAQSWDQAASFFKGKVSKADWEKMVGSVRNQVGKSENRTLASAQYTTKLPGAPDGEYVVIQYKSAFANQPTAIETIVPMLDKDGKWHVSGYFIKPAEQ